MSIFISIASYRDSVELEKTVDSLIENSDNPQNLRIIILSQDRKRSHVDFSRYDNVELFKVDFRKARGAGWARKRIMEEYKGEDFFFQIDSHERFAKSWDTKIVEMFNQASSMAKTNKIILSQYPEPYEPHTDGKDHYIKGNSSLWDRVSWTAVRNNWHGCWTGCRQEIEDKTKPHITHSILAGYVFASGSFVEEIPYDERISFMGEELCIAIRAYTRGWKIYAPNEMLVWHFYKRRGESKPWTQMDDSVRDIKWVDLEMESKKTQELVLRGIEKGVYGIEDHDLYLEYQDLVGINFDEFYNKGISEKINKAALTEELDFLESVKKSGWCSGGEHNQCETSGCECQCHPKEDEDEWFRDKYPEYDQSNTNNI